MSAATEGESQRRGERSVRNLLATVRVGVGLVHEANVRLFWATMAGEAFGAVLLGLQVYLGKLALDAVLRLDGPGSVSGALWPIGLLVLLTVLSGVSGAVEGLGERLLAAYLQRQTIDRIFDVTTRVPLDVFEGPEFHDDLSRVLVSSRERPLAMAQGLVQLAGGAIGVLGLSVALIALQPLLLPILLLAALPLWVLARRTGRLEYFFAISQTGSIRWRDYLVLVLTGRAEAKEVRAFGLGPRLRRDWSRSFEAYLAALQHHLRRVVSVNLVGALLTTVFTTAALGALVTLVADGKLSVADAGAAAIAIRLLATRIQAVFLGVGRLLEASLFVEDLDGFLRRGHAGDLDAGRPARAPGEFREVALEDVSFTYPGVDVPVLRGASVRIGAGEVVALVGDNGSGKTTLAKLMARLFHPTSGTLRLNGVDARELRDEDVREQVGVIFQDFVRYDLSAGDNIAVGLIEARNDRAGVAEAARRGRAEEVIARLPGGYDQVVGRRFRGGVELSGGEWQKVAIARAWMRDAALLILDEPTAALDARAEFEVFERFRALSAGRTVVLISHRFASVRTADRILVLAQGRVEASGTHDELTAQGGRYAELFELQAAGYR